MGETSQIFGGWAVFHHFGGGGAGARILENEGGDAACLRVAVQGGKLLHGFSYVFSIDETRGEDDHAFARDGVTVLVDDMSLAYMTGAEIDWVDDMIGAAFKSKTPMPRLPAAAAHLLIFE